MAGCKELMSITNHWYYWWWYNHKLNFHLYAFEIPFQQNWNPACRGSGCLVPQVRLKLTLGNVVFIHVSLTDLIGSLDMQSARLICVPARCWILYWYIDTEQQCPPLHPAASKGWIPSFPQLLCIEDNWTSNTYYSLA